MNLKDLLQDPNRLSDEWFETLWSYTSANRALVRMELGFLDKQERNPPMSKDPDYLAGYNMENFYGKQEL